jgi:hypothetical protein
MHAPFYDRKELDGDQGQELEDSAVWGVALTPSACGSPRRV